MMAWYRGTYAFLAPTILRLIDPSEAGLVLKHQTDAFFSVENFVQLLDFGVNFFEVAMTSSLAFFGWRLLGMIFLHPCRCSTL